MCAHCKPTSIVIIIFINYKKVELFHACKQLIRFEIIQEISTGDKIKKILIGLTEKKKKSEFRIVRFSEPAGPFETGSASFRNRINKL